MHLTKVKRPISIDKVNIKRILLSRKNLYGQKDSFKSFIEYISETNAFPLPLEVNLPQMNRYDKDFNVSVK